MTPQELIKIRRDLISKLLEDFKSTTPGWVSEEVSRLFWRLDTFSLHDLELLVSQIETGET